MNRKFTLLAGIIGTALLSVSPCRAAEDELYRCGTIYQNRECSSGVDGTVLKDLPPVNKYDGSRIPAVPDEEPRARFSGSGIPAESETDAKAAGRSLQPDPQFREQLDREKLISILNQAKDLNLNPAAAGADQLQGRTIRLRADLNAICTREGTNEDSEKSQLCRKSNEELLKLERSSPGVLGRQP